MNPELSAINRPVLIMNEITFCFLQIHWALLIKYWRRRELNVSRRFAWVSCGFAGQEAVRGQVC